MIYIEYIFLQCHVSFRYFVDIFWIRTVRCSLNMQIWYYLNISRHLRNCLNIFEFQFVGKDPLQRKHKYLTQNRLYPCFNSFCSVFLLFFSIEWVCAMAMACYSFVCLLLCSWFVFLFVSFPVIYFCVCFFHKNPFKWWWEPYPVTNFPNHCIFDFWDGQFILEYRRKERVPLIALALWLKMT